MKKVTILFMLSLAFVVLPGLSNAGGNVPYNVDILTSKTSATSNGSDAVQVTINTWDYQCTGTAPAGYGGPDYGSEPAACSVFTPATTSIVGKSMSVGNKFYVTISGSGNNQPAKQYFTTDSNGNFSFTLKSSIAEAKEIVVGEEPGGMILMNSSRSVLKKSVSFIAPTSNQVPSSTSTSTTNRTSNSTQSQTNSSTQSTTPTLTPAPVIQTVKVGSLELKKDDLTGQAFASTEKKIFEGVTIPNGLVHLYFHSDPFEDTVVANAEGKWSYELTRDLGEGDHSLELTVTDQATNLTSIKSEPIKFAIVAGENNKNESAKNEVKKVQNFWYVIMGVVMVFIAVSAYAIYFFLHKKKLSKV